MVEKFSNHLSITDQTPPAFMVHTSADKAVPPENSILFYMGLRKAGVPAELHIFEQGKHGLGLGQKDPAFNTWPELCIEWMKKRKIIK